LYASTSLSAIKFWFLNYKGLIGEVWKITKVFPIWIATDIEVETSTGFYAKTRVPNLERLSSK
jgi:hypothetical protein